MQSYLLNRIILDARANLNKTFRDLVWGYDVSGHEEKLKELIYDARQDREFDYMSVAERNEILDREIILVGKMQHFDQKLKRTGYKDSGFIAYDGDDTLLVGFKGKETLKSGYMYAPYIPMHRTFPKLIAEDLVSVQPMSKPCSVARDFDYGIPEVELELESKTIATKTRKLKCNWSMSQVVDMSFDYDLYNEKYFTDLLASEIRGEIDKEIIDSLKSTVYKLNTSADNLYSKKTINKNYYKKLVIDNHFFDSSTSNLVDADFTSQASSSRWDTVVLPKIAPVDIPF